MNTTTDNTTAVNTQSQKEADAEELAQILAALTPEQKKNIQWLAMGVKLEAERAAMTDKAG